MSGVGISPFDKTLQLSRPLARRGSWRLTAVKRPSFTLSRQQRDLRE